MKILGILFIVLGVIALIYTLVTAFTGGDLNRGDNLPFTDNGTMVLSVICLMAGAGLLLMVKNRSKKEGR